jgi:hypothetical protein
VARAREERAAINAKNSRIVMVGWRLEDRHPLDMDEMEMRAAVVVRTPKSITWGRSSNLVVREKATPPLSESRFLAPLRF